VTRTYRRARAVLAGLVLAVGLGAAGCDVVTSVDYSDGVLAYENDLADSGHDAVVTWDVTAGTGEPAGEGVLIYVTVGDHPSDPAGWRRDAADIAGIGWRQLPYRVFAITVTGLSAVDGRNGGPPAPVVFDRAALERSAGPRPATLDAEGYGDLADDAAVTDGTPVAGDPSAPGSPDGLLAVAGWTCAGLVALVAVGGLVTWLVLRRRRKKAVPGREAASWPPPPPPGRWHTGHPGVAPPPVHPGHPGHPGAPAPGPWPTGQPGTTPGPGHPGTPPGPGAWPTGHPGAPPPGPWPTGHPGVPAGPTPGAPGASDGEVSPWAPPGGLS
jgi:hypothetical protein